MKWKKILFYNLLFIIIFFILCEISSFCILTFRYKEAIANYNALIEKKIFPVMKYSKAVDFSFDGIEEQMRKVEYRNSQKKPIILFGCSYTYGFGLDEEETFSRKLADYTDRTVYNRGFIGTGLPLMYYQLSNESIIKKLPHDAEYVIFTLIPDHFPRLFRYRNFVLTSDHTLRYKLKNDKLVIDKIHFKLLHSLFMSIILEEYIATRNTNNENKLNKLFFKIIVESNKLIKKNFSNAKLVILYFLGPDDDDNAYKEYIDILENQYNIKVIKVNEILPEIKQNADKYFLIDNFHPSAEAWNVIVPELSRELNL